MAGFNGHVMAMTGAKLYLSGVKLDRMGQRGRLARYPVHWHMMGSVEGQDVEQSSINHSYNRRVTVHASHQAVVKVIATTADGPTTADGGHFLQRAGDVLDSNPNNDF